MSEVSRASEYPGAPDDVGDVAKPDEDMIDAPQAPSLHRRRSSSQSSDGEEAWAFTALHALNSERAVSVAESKARQGSTPRAGAAC